MAILGNVTTIVGPIGTTAYNCFDHKKGTFDFTFNEKKAKTTLKRAIPTTSILSTLNFGEDLSNDYLNDMYAEAMSASQISEMERLLAQKEQEFTVDGITYNLAEIDPVATPVEANDLQMGKAYEKKL